MKRLVACLSVLLTACSQTTGRPTAAIPATPSQTATATTTGSAIVSPSPSTSASPGFAFADIPLTTVGFTCWLPIYSQNPISDSFISFPSGDVRSDPNGVKGMYFDRAYSRWVPVARGAISPDGAHYATVEIGSQPGILLIHIVDVATNNDHTIQLPASSDFGLAQPTVFDYAPEGIYLVQAFEHIWAGVWLFDPATGSIRKAADVETPEIIGANGALWYGQVNPIDPNPFSTRSSAGILPDEVDRFDLRSGNRTQWLYRPGVSLQVIGVDVSARPLIQVLVPGSDPNIASTGFVDHAQSEVLLGLSSTSYRSIFKGGLAETLRAPIADSHGVWFGSDQGIYLYSDAGGLQKVSNQPGFPANGCL